MSSEPPAEPEPKAMSPAQLAEMHSKWLPEILEQNPHILALRERALPWTGGFSFSRLANTEMTSSLAHVNRKVILELIIQHLFALGMNRTAEAIIKETGHTYQMKEQPWDKTDLAILVSLGVLPLEDPWNIQEDPGVKYVEEPLEEDFFAFPYREDPHGIAKAILDPDADVIWVDVNSPKTYQNIKASSLNRFVLSLTNYGVRKFINDEDLSAFFLSLNTVTSNLHFFEHLKVFFNMEIDEAAKEALGEQEIANIQIAIINLIKKWVNGRGLFIGRRTLKSIKAFCEDYQGDENSTNKKLLTSIAQSMDTLTYGSREGKLNNPSELPNIREGQVSLLLRPGLTLIDPEPEETARQITLLSHASFKSINIREFMAALKTKECSVQTPVLGEFLNFQERTGQLILETVLLAGDRHAAFARVLEIAQHLEQLSNFQSLSSILSKFRRPEVLTVVQATPKQAELLEQLAAKCGDAEGSFDAYASYLCIIFREWKSAIPNITAEIANSKIHPREDFLKGLINWEKRRESTARAGIFYRLQNKPYSFYAIHQIQKVINKGPSRTPAQLEDMLCDLWRAVKQLL